MALNFASFFPSLTGRRRTYDALGDYAPCGDARPLWARMPQELLSAKAYDKAFRAHYFDADGAQRGGNADIPVRMDLCVGTWKIDDGYPLNYGFDVEQLRYFRPEDLEPAEDPLQMGRGAYVERYQEWLRAGLDAPPVHAVQHEKGHWRVVDGNRRYLAHKREGRLVPAWASPAVWSGLHDYDGKPMVTGLTWEIAVQDAIHAGHPVPSAVRAEFERRLPRFENLRRRARALAGEILS